MLAWVGKEDTFGFFKMDGTYRQENAEAFGRLYQRLTDPAGRSDRYVPGRVHVYVPEETLEFSITQTNFMDAYFHAAAEPARVYTYVDDECRLIVPADAPAMDASWIAFLRQFLPQLRQLIEDEGLAAVSYYHVSDEPGGNPRDIENYLVAREKLRELAPWTDGRVMDAMSDITYGRRKLIDFPFPNVASAANYVAEGIPHWVYYCCGPLGPYTNRFYDTPLVRTRMIGMLRYKLGALGFLHWGYNFWCVMDLGNNSVPQQYVDPYGGRVTEPFGDAHVVYPGASGPVDSIRWEVFAEGLQDYAILQSAGVPRDDPLLQDIVDYGAFPRSEEWLRTALDRALDRAGETGTRRP